MVSGSGEILSFNRSFKRDLWPDSESAVSKNLIELSTTEPEKIKKYLRNCSGSSQMTIGKMDFPAPDEKRSSYRCEGSLLEPADGNQPEIIFLRFKPKELTDVRFRLLTEEIDKLNLEIVERKRAVAHNKKLYQQAKEASRLKDEFLATISHELRTPLNAIVGWVKILGKGGIDEDLFRKALATIERNSLVQVQLIEDILNVSRIVTGKMNLNIRPVELATVIENSIDSARPMAENKGIELHTFLDSDAGVVSGDSERIQQIVWNLLSNALKFTPKGGSVEVRLARVYSNIEISVSDTGEGIPKEFLPFVFERFLQADASKTRKHGGLGLGLAIVRHLTELHGGSVEVYSEGKGKGTVFTVKFPVAVRALEDQVKNSILKDISHSDTLERNLKIDNFRLEDLRILIVDDETDSREVLKIVLEESKARVEIAGSAAEGFEKFSVNNFDILISDLAMPGEDGFSLVKRIRALTDHRHKNVPAIAMTAHARKEDRLQALSGGFDSFIAKPFDPDELITLITNVIKLDKNSEN